MTIIEADCGGLSTSRLGCQITFDAGLDGMTATLPDTRT